MYLSENCSQVQFIFESSILGFLESAIKKSLLLLILEGMAFRFPLQDQISPVMGSLKQKIERFLAIFKESNEGF